MKGAARTAPNNILPLRSARRTAAQEQATRAAGQVRRQLSLLQGYADLMEGLSPEQNMQILRVMAEKIRELTVALYPFLEQAEIRAAAIEDYRQARVRTRQLLTEYRQLLDRLHHTVDDAPAGVGLPIA